MIDSRGARTRARTDGLTRPAERSWKDQTANAGERWRPCGLSERIFAWCDAPSRHMTEARTRSSYVGAVLPAALVRGLGLGLAVTPLTAAVLAAVGDADLGEASAINDAASRVGGVIAIALVPILIGVGAGSTLAESLAQGYHPAMIAIGGLCLVAAIVTLIFVSDERAATPMIVPPDRGCTLPTRGPAEPS